MELAIHVIQKTSEGLAPVNLVVDVGGITINGDSNLANTHIHTVTVADDSAVDISVNQSGFHMYSMTIDNVYASDKTIYIMMVSIVNDIESVSYNKPVPYHFFFINPCSFKVDFYNASSFTGDVSWYINNNPLTEGVKGTIDLCGVGLNQLKVRNQTYITTTLNNCPQRTLMWDKQWANTEVEEYLLPGQEVSVGETGNSIAEEIDLIDTYLSLDTQTNLEIVEYRPDIKLNISTPADQLQDSCCYTLGESITVTPSITLTRDGADLSSHTIAYSLIDPDQNTITLDVMPLDISSITTTFTLDALGTYKLIAVVSDIDCSIDYTKELIFETCDFIVLEYVDCNTYMLHNKSSHFDVTYTADSIDGSIAAELTTLNAGESKELKLDEISLYFLTISYADPEVTEKVFILNNYCGLDDCISKYILDILCEDKGPCDSCPDDVTLNQMLLLSYTYFMQLNNEYGWNNFYSGLNDSKLEELSNIKQTMDKLVEFCKRRGCEKQLSSYTPTKTGNCNSCK